MYQGLVGIHLHLGRIYCPTLLAHGTPLQVRVLLDTVIGRLGLTTDPFLSNDRRLCILVDCPRRQRHTVVG
jgi:hypothetical protein